MAAAIRAPEHAVAWIPRVGWTDDHIDVRHAQDAGDTVYHVTDGRVNMPDDGLAAAARVEAERVDLHERLIDIFESALDRLAVIR